MDKQELVVAILRSELPGLAAVYAFGSRVQGVQRADSDLDLAVLGRGKFDVLALWQLSARLADLSDVDVDLLDLRAASTVMQHQVLTRGERWWCESSAVDMFEAVVLHEKFELDRARKDLLDQIQTEGRVHG